MKLVFISLLLVLYVYDVDGNNGYYRSYNGHYSYVDRNEIHANLAKINTNKQTISSHSTSIVNNNNKISSITTKLNNHATEISGMKTSFKATTINQYQNITKHVSQVKDELQKGINTNVQSLQTKDQQLQSKLDELEERIKVGYSHCRSLPASTCGPCLCFDDYKLSSRHYCDCQNFPPKRDCLEFLQSGFKVNGVYKVTLNGLKIIQVFCDQTTDGGGWTIFQRRYDGSADFYRSWNAYEEGFGTLQHEFWMGNKNLHYLTLQALYQKGSELRIDMTKMSDGTKSFAKYQHFQVYNKVMNYMLIIMGYSGTAGDSLSLLNGKHFSTYDKDNDMDSNQHCARVHQGAWWYGGIDCGLSNLNGLLDKSFEGNNTERIYWKTLGKKESLNFVEMKTRRVV